MGQQQTVVVLDEGGSDPAAEILQSFLDEEGADQSRVIAYAHPRQSATDALADRVAKELDVWLGEEVLHTVPYGELPSGTNTLIKCAVELMASCTRGLSSQVPSSFDYALFVCWRQSTWTCLNTALPNLCMCKSS